MPAPDRAAPRTGASAWRSLTAAIAFLTRLPVDRRGTISRRDVARGAVLFPLVGATIGAIVALTAWAARGVVPPIVAAACAVAVESVLTGALHLDGLADTADGYGGDTRERTLEIMRDHATGAFGTAAIALDLLVKSATIAALLSVGRGLAIVVAAGALSRGAVATVGSVARQARAEPGTGAVLGGDRPVMRSIGAALVALVVAVGVAGLRGLVAAAAVAAISLGWTFRCYRRLGGVTGDTLGANAEAAEIATLLVGVAFR